jgi:hypothetical protein
MRNHVPGGAWITKPVKAAWFSQFIAKPGCLGFKNRSNQFLVKIEASTVAKWFTDRFLVVSKTNWFLIFQSLS